MTEQQRGLIVPTIDADSAAWWAGLTAGVLTLQRCSQCTRHRCPPLPACPYCGGPESTNVAATGLGRIYSWTVVHRSLSPHFDGDEPYTVLTVGLDEGPRIFGRLLTGRPAAQARVRASFYEVDGTTLLGFEALVEPEVAPDFAPTAHVGL